MSQGPLHLYRAKLEAGELRADPAQALAAEKLESLYHALAGYRPDGGQGGWKERFGLTRRPRQPAPQGLYIFGEVGRGKSMLMDIFHASAPIEKKRRVHFHAFMQEVHKRLKDLRQAVDKGDPMPPLAKQVAAEAWLLCFDEFQVDNIADAMILGRLFEALFAEGVVVVATSNRPPRDLYKDGLQRDRFLPFIDLIGQRLDLLELKSDLDYRLGRMKTLRVYLTPVDDATGQELERAFQELTYGAPAHPHFMIVMGRHFEIRLAASGVAMTHFDDLCRQPRGAPDFLLLANRFHTVIMEGIPRLTPDDRNEAKRFVTLIDTLYEHKVKLICSAEVPAERLYAEGSGAFEFQRTVSRLMEMQSAEYMALEHQPD